MNGLGSGLSFDKVDPAVVDDDPFWAAVRRRHPDIDIVLLPDDGGDDTDVDGRSGLALDRCLPIVDGLANAWGVVSRSVGDPAVVPDLSWEEGDGGHALLAHLNVLDRGVDGGVELLRAVARDLDRHGWRFAAGRRSGRPLLQASDGRLDLEAEVGTAVTTIRLATGVLPIAAPEREALLARVRGAVDGSVD